MGTFPLISPGQRGEMFFVEHCRVHVRDGVVVREEAEGAAYNSYNIPVQNTSMLLMGDGTSISRDAACMLAKANVTVAFTGGGGTPLYSGVPVDFLPMASANEYRPTEYMQAWGQRFFNEDLRLETAKELLRARGRLTKQLWNTVVLTEGADLAGLYRGEGLERAIAGIHDTQALLAAEGRHAIALYKNVAATLGAGDFTRTQRGDDPVNQRLDHFNYLLYGCAATVLHGLGISFAFSALHGKTRRGGLVFDIADLVKDGLSVPLAFLHGTNGTPDGESRAIFMRMIHREKIIPLLFNETKRILCGK